MNRRGFLGSILALGAAPAIVKVANLMPVRSDIIYTMPEVLSFNPVETPCGGMMQLYVADAAKALATQIDREMDTLIAEWHIEYPPGLSGATLFLPDRS